MININNLRLTYKKNIILKDVTFTLHNGEILGIAGPAGCGKSSLLKAVSGKTKAAEGTIEINSKKLSEIRKKEISSVISSLTFPYEYDPEATVFEETIKGRIHLKKFLNPFSEIDRNSTYYILNETGLSDSSSSRLKRSSGSIIRMTLIARTINSESDNILLDSPEQGLDLSQKLSVIRALKKYTARGDKSVLLASSELDFLVKVCDRIIVLKYGAFHESGGSDIITDELIKRVFGVDAMIVKNIITGLPEIHIIDNE